MTPYNYYVYQFNDIQEGNQRWHQGCQQCLRREIPKLQQSVFDALGYERFNSVPEGLVTEYLERTKEQQQAQYGPCHPKNEKILIVMDQEVDGDLMVRMAEAILCEEVDAQLLNFFKSEYMIFTYDTACNYRRPLEGIYSYHWHRDAGATYHVKLILYLNDCQIIGAGTEVIDMERTRQIGNVGYDFLPIDDRTNDLSAYFEAAGLEPHSELISPPAGTQIVFRPRDILHRGIYPNCDKPRYTLTFLLAPSALPWRESLKFWSFHRAQKNSGARPQPLKAIPELNPLY